LAIFRLIRHARAQNPFRPAGFMLAQSGRGKAAWRRRPEFTRGRVYNGEN